MKKLLFLLTALILAATPAQAQTADSKKEPEVSFHKEILDSVANSLVKSRGGKGDVAPLRQKKYLFIYFSASWCGPCRQFTPDLVTFYNENEKNGDFDILFVSSDSDQKSMAAYMKSDKMPWMGVKLDSKGAKALDDKYSGRGIPCLVLLDEKDQIVAHSYVKGKYVGPRSVLRKYQELKTPAVKK